MNETVKTRFKFEIEEDKNNINLTSKTLLKKT